MKGEYGLKRYVRYKTHHQRMFTKEIVISINILDIFLLPHTSVNDDFTGPKLQNRVNR
jgi:hypothetical protein